MTKSTGYLTVTKGQALPDMSDTIDAYYGVQRSTANIGRTFIGYEGDRSIKSDYNRQDYTYFRPSEIIPNRTEDIIRMCERAYQKVGLVRNAIDLMGDFACQGITLVHPNPSIERFYKEWFNKVNGPERSERFLNQLYRTANVVIRRLDGKIPNKMVKEWKKTTGDADIEFEKLETKSHVIPAKYVFYSPLAVEVVGGDLSNLVGKPVYALKIHQNMRNIINKYVQYKGNEERFSYLSNDGDIAKMIDSMPKDMVMAILKGDKYLPLDQDKISVFHYKKDDWETWARPMLSAVLSNLIQLEKLDLADTAALDGAISNIRLWNLGIFLPDNPEMSILPTATSVNKLRSILAGNLGGGTLDLVWGPELKFTESNSQVHHFLGPEKYSVTLNSIYVGLGIPPVLSGSASDGNFTNNYITVKTLVERLEYGRSVLVRFWNQEIKRVQQAMGFRLPAQVAFDQMVLSDEAAEKNLLIQLADRDIISPDTLRGKFDISSDVERTRLRRDVAKRGVGNNPFKASQFHSPQVKDDKEKMFIQSGNVTPTQVGLNLPDKKAGEKTPSEVAHESQMKLAEKKGQDKLTQKKFKPKKTANGRPKKKQDSKPRKKKRVLPRTKGFIDTTIWATSTYNQIAPIVTSSYLKTVKKANLRKLSASETTELEDIKLFVLSNLTPFSDITEEKVYNIMTQDIEINKSVISTYNKLVSNYKLNNKKEPNIDEKRQMQISACVFYYKK